MSKKVQFGDVSNRDKTADLEEFRHEQTIKRWKAKNKRKVSKVIYLSDYLPENNHAEHSSHAAGKGGSGHILLSMGSQYEKTFKKSARTRSPTKVEKKAAAPASNKKVNFKVKASDSTVPFNHYARHTKLKRTIMASREAALRNLLLTSADAPQKELLWYLLLLSRQMQKIYIRVDACMRQKRFAQVRHLKRMIRHVRYKVKRVIEKKNFCLTAKQKEKVTALQTTFYESVRGSNNSNNDEASEWVPVDGEEESSAFFFAKFDPTLVELAMVVAKNSGSSNDNEMKVDRRSGRYPVVLSDEALQQFHQHCRYDDLATTTTYCLSDPFSATGAAMKQVKVRPPLFAAPYCRNVMIDLLDDLAFTTLQKLYHEQKKLKDKQPLQFKSRQRYVVGLQETIKCLRAKQVKLVLLAADMEAFAPAQLSENVSLTEEKGSADASSMAQKDKGARRKFQSLAGAIEDIERLCSETTDIPCVTCMSRQRLSYALFAKQSKISCVGIMHAEQGNEWLKALKLCATAMLNAFDSGME